MTGRRLTPPVLEPGMILREGVVARLAARWDRQVVAVVAGPGFGKSTALAQAHAANHLDPRGVDRWLRCEPSDAVPSHLVAGLAAAVGYDDVGLRHDVDAILDGLLDHVAATWPLGVALTLDDVHLIVDGGAAVLRRLVRDAPACLHLVLAARTPIPGLARRRAHDEVVDVGEADLRLTPGELAQLAQRGDVSAEALASVEGWPALAELVVRTGGVGQEAFSFALRDLQPDRRRSLAEVVATGGGQPAAIEAAQSVPIPAATLLTGLPMISTHLDGTMVPHQLWERILDGVLDVTATRAARARVASWFLARDDVEQAAPLAAASGDWDLFRRVLAQACSRGYAGPARDVLARWLTLLPPELHDEPAGLLLRGVAARAGAPFSPDTLATLERAMEGFRAAGPVAGEVAAMSEYVYVARIRGELHRLPPVVMRLVELDAGGHPEAEGPFRLAKALMAEAADDDATFLAELEAIPPAALSPEWMAVVDYLRSLLLLNFGRADDAIAAADRAVHHGGPGYLGGYYAAIFMRWYAGQPARALAELPLAGSLPGATPVDRLYSGIYTAMVDAFAGRLDRAKADLEIARQSLHPAARPEVHGELAGAAAAVAVAAGDEPGAATILREHFQRAPLSSAAGHRPVLRFLALAYVLLPEARPEIDALPLGPLHQTTRDLAATFVAARSDDVGDPRLPPVPDVAVRLPLRWGAELTVRLVAAGHQDGRRLALGLADLHGPRFRDAVRALQHEGDPAARRLLRSVAVDGGASVTVGVLGPTTLVVDGRPVEGGEWSRRAVRAVLSHLVARSGCSRDAVIGTVWPDLDQGRAENNLRATLSHLVRLLEPDRGAGEASFLLRAERSELVLADPPAVNADVWQLDDLIDRADSARVGTPSAALPLYEQALDLWRGEPYPDIDDLPWVATERDRLRARFVAASVRSAEIHLASGHGDRAVARAADALQVEPWSEDAYRLLIAAHLARGDRSSAQRALGRCLQMLAEAGAQPAPETQMVVRLLQSPVAR